MGCTHDVLLKFNQVRQRKTKTNGDVVGQRRKECRRFRLVGASFGPRDLESLLPYISGKKRKFAFLLDLKSLKSNTRPSIDLSSKVTLRISKLGRESLTRNPRETYIMTTYLPSLTLPRVVFEQPAVSVLLPVVCGMGVGYSLKRR